MKPEALFSGVYIRTYCELLALTALPRTPCGTEWLRGPPESTPSTRSSSSILDARDLFGVGFLTPARVLAARSNLRLRLGAPTDGRKLLPEICDTPHRRVLLFFFRPYHSPPSVQSKGRLLPNVP